MATSVADPPPTIDGFELPPCAADIAKKQQEVSWSKNPDEIDEEMPDSRLIQIKYEIAATLSVKNVFKETLTMFRKTDPAFRLISKANNTTNTFKIADELDKLSRATFIQLFPAEIAGEKTC